MVLAEWIREAENVVIFSGAGMSTESGLRDFRSFDRGMWNDRDPMELASTTAMEKNRDEFIRFYQWRIQEMLKHQPNQGHRILAKWEDAGIVKGIITQNVENYHEQAGTKNIAKLHGDLGTLRCMVCGRRYACEDYLPPLSRTACACGGFIRPNIVLFGEMLPQEALELAEQLLQKADLFLVLGSSLTVSPANQFPVLAKQQGARLVIVNREPTPLDPMADLTLHRSIGEVLGEADGILANGKSRL